MRCDTLRRLLRGNVHVGDEHTGDVVFAAVREGLGRSVDRRRLGVRAAWTGFHRDFGIGDHIRQSVAPHSEAVSVFNEKWLTSTCTSISSRVSAECVREHVIERGRFFGRRPAARHVERRCDRE